MPEIEIPETALPPETIQEKIEIESGSAKVKSEWDCKINNPDEEERQFCSPDQKKLNTAVKAGIRKIKGCEITEIFKTKVRLTSKKKDSEMQF